MTHSAKTEVSEHYMKVVEYTSLWLIRNAYVDFIDAESRHNLAKYLEEQVENDKS